MTKLEEDNWKDLLIRYQQEEIKELRARLAYWLLDGKKNDPVSKLKLFIETFNFLTSPDHNEVPEQTLLDALIGTTQFTDDEARVYIKKAKQNGQIYEHKAGLLAKA